ncbi:MAG: hypothetical protein HN778_17935 [Prolixibacteraceae bacterium]|jgi:hypothetical protein|nr:hypothetical protein [Prolixibacteraceae bacterium]MBT6006627.1 hypothetical protein [Prolixibacteraceae bacterium]MBT6763533.1 hypothetical protein [Prolixibacteraceae bacterium]MBT6997224.1 hypothetical protein [Prolixibacteraceae bacterium]MBT7396713.1 hypothetical protein [Prolixibacteraceae bacterium]
MGQLVEHTNPKPFFTNLQNIKAFVLGCDPTAFDRNQNRLEFEYVFDLGNDERYFTGILKNLKLIGISLNDVYVQNLVTDYQEEETSKNRKWEEVAKESISQRKNELDLIDVSGEIPVFLTSELLYKVLLNQGLERNRASQFYNLEINIPIPADNNLLNRPLLPFYRHYRYKLSEQKSYLSYLQSFFRLG